MNHGIKIYGINKNIPAIIVMAVNGLNMYKKPEINANTFFCFIPNSEKTNIFEKTNIPKNPMKRNIKLNKNVKVDISNIPLANTNVKNNGAF